jgi:hypothetical protein
MNTPITIHLPLAQAAAEGGPSLLQRTKTGAIKFLHAYLEVAEREGRVAAKMKVYRD